MNEQRPAPTAIVYDGECPFCSAYVRLVRLRESLGTVQLIDAREGGPLVDEIHRRGYDLDRGMVLAMNGEFFHGDECIHRLALLSTESGLFNRLNALVFRSRATARVLYPVMRTGRNLTLALLRRRPLTGSPSQPTRDDLVTSDTRSAPPRSE